MTEEFDITVPLAAFRERLLAAVAEEVRGGHVNTVRQSQRRGRRGLGVAIVIGVLAAGSALAMTANRLTDIRFFGADTPQPAPRADAPGTSAVSLSAVAAAINKDPASGPGVQASDLRVLAEAKTHGGPVRVVMGATVPVHGEEARAMCQAVTVGPDIRNAGCTLVAPTDDLWTNRRADIDGQRDAVPGLLGSFPIPNVGVITGYAPRSGVSGTMTVTDAIKPVQLEVSDTTGRKIPVGVLDGVWVTLVTAEDLGVSKFDTEHGSNRTMRLEITDREGKVVYQVTNIAF